MKHTPNKIREDKLWQGVLELVQVIYGHIDDIITRFPSEEWATASKLRNSAIDSLFYVSQAVGSAYPEMNQYDLSNARKNLFSLQTMYIFAAKQKFIELDPELILKIDALLALIDKRLSVS